MPHNGLEDPEDWARQDALERSSLQVELDEDVTEYSGASLLHVSLSSKRAS